MRNWATGRARLAERVAVPGELVQHAAGGACAGAGVVPAAHRDRQLGVRAGAEAGGLLGALFAGWGSDLLFSGQRAPMILLFTLGLMVSVAALWLAPVHHYALLAVCFFTVGFFVFGPQMLIGLAAVECGHKAAAGSISGFLGLFAYLGAALAGWPLSLVIERYGWSGMFSLLSVAAVLMGLLLMPLLMASITTSAAQRIK